MCLSDCRITSKKGNTVIKNFRNTYRTHSNQFKRLCYFLCCFVVVQKCSLFTTKIDFRTFRVLCAMCAHFEFSHIYALYSNRERKQT